MIQPPNSWSAGPTKLFGDSSLNETWTMLPDGSVMSYDVNGTSPGEAQRMDPATMSWIDSGNVPVPLEAGISAYPTMGPGVLLPDGRLLQLGRSSQTAIYTPSATPGGTGTWAAGPVIPGGLEAGGGAANMNIGSAAAMLPNGHVLFDADKPDSGGPTKFFEFDPTAPLATSLTDVTPSTIAQFQNASEDFMTYLLVLPNGQVMLGINNGGAGGMGNQAYVYTPDGAPQAAWKPTISSITSAGGNNYTLTGTQLNGLSAGASHGGNTSGGTNYPIVELKDHACPATSSERPTTNAGSINPTYQELAVRLRHQHAGASPTATARTARPATPARAPAPGARVRTGRRATSRTARPRSRQRPASPATRASGPTCCRATAAAVTR